VLQRRNTIGIGTLALLVLAGAPRPAHAQVFADDLRAKGFWPDAALSLGAGIGVGNALDTNVHSRLRLGALYAYEPWIVNLGLSGELGAIGERGVGVDLEFNHFGGPWLQGGVARVTHDDFMSHVALGFALFGVEWQHRFAAPNENALIFLLRAPIGIWWFLAVDNARPASAKPVVGAARAGAPGP
jgi:hypothetical protein